MINCRISGAAARCSNITDYNGVVASGQPSGNPALNDGERVGQHGKAEITEYEVVAVEFCRPFGSKTPSKWLMFRS
jgi:hypothetical protein